jgi:hypothetical protein
MSQLTKPESGHGPHFSPVFNVLHTIYMADFIAIENKLFERIGCVTTLLLLLFY